MTESSIFLIEHARPMSTKSEIAEIKARLNRIEEFLRTAFPAIGISDPASVPEKSDSDFKLVSFNVRKASGIAGHEYSYKLKVQNKVGSSVRFMGWVVFLDKDEFEVSRGIIPPFSVPAKQTITVTGMWGIVDERQANRIVDVTAEIRPI